MIFSLFLISINAILQSHVFLSYYQYQLRTRLTCHAQDSLLVLISILENWIITKLGVGSLSLEISTFFLLCYPVLQVGNCR